MAVRLAADCTTACATSRSPFLALWLARECADACPLSLADRCSAALPSVAGVVEAAAFNLSRSESAAVQSLVARVSVFFKQARGVAAPLFSLWAHGAKVGGPVTLASFIHDDDNDDDEDAGAGGPVPRPDAWFPRGTRMADCVRMAGLLLRWDFELGEDAMDACEEVADARDELWERAVDMQLAPAAAAAVGGAAEAHVAALWSRMETESEWAWVGVSWVPVYERMRDGHGEGHRSDALLVELLVGSPVVDAATNAPEDAVETAVGRWRVHRREFAALLPCDGQALADVVDCVGRAVPSARVRGVVLGLGFAEGRKAAYEAVRADWNTHARYGGTGVIPEHARDDL